MAIKLTSVKCPDCNAMLEIEEGRQCVFCSFCGNQIFITNENEYVHRIVDEARIKQAETERLIQLKRMEYFEKVKGERIQSRDILIKISIILGVISVVSFGIGFAMTSGFFLLLGLLSAISIVLIWKHYNEKEKELVLGKKIRVPAAISNYENKNYATIEELFKSVGFTNVKSIPLNDIIIGILKKPGMVANITVNGENIYSGGRKFFPNATIVISYHSR